MVEITRIFLWLLVEELQFMLYWMVLYLPGDAVLPGPFFSTWANGPHGPHGPQYLRCGRKFRGESRQISQQEQGEQNPHRERDS